MLRRLFKKTSWLLLFAVILLLAAIAGMSWFQHQTAIKQSLNYSDKVLLTAARAVPAILPPNYHDYATHEDSVSLEEEIDNRLALTPFCLQNNLQRLGTIVEKDGQFYMTSLVLNDAEADNQSSWYWAPFTTVFNNIPQSFVEALASVDEHPVWAEIDTRYGVMRVVAFAQRSPSGNKYLVCASVNIDTIEAQASSVLIDSLIAFGVLFLSSLPILFVLQNFSQHLFQVNNELRESRDRIQSLYSAQTTELSETMSSLDEAHLRLERIVSVFESILEGLIIFDETLIILDVNPAVEKITGWAVADLKGKKVTEILGVADGALFHETGADSLLAKGWEGDGYAIAANGKLFQARVRITLLSTRGRMYYVASFHDITERKHKEKAIEQLALYDALTGLPNRNYLHTHLEDMLLSAKNVDEIAIIYFDLDGFKAVNDTVGHDGGDDVLREVAQRIPQRLRKSDVMIRLGGDEFVIVCTTLKHSSQAIDVAKRLLEAFVEPFIVEGISFKLGASIGIAIPPEGGINGNDLLRNADTAMYEAKQAGKNCYRVYSPSLINEEAMENTLPQRLHTAIEEKAFEMHFQPIIDFNSGKLFGVETFARWRLNDGLETPKPAEFIATTEATGNIVPLSSILIEKTLLGLKELLPLYPNLIAFANISPVLLRSKRMIPLLEDLLRQHNVTKKQLVLEFSENTLASDEPLIQQAFQECAEEGFLIGVDDFGKEYHSFEFLQSLELDYIKVDNSYVHSLTEQSAENKLLGDIHKMAEDIGAIAIAESVETKAQVQFLYESGYAYAQGDIFCRALPLMELKDILEENRKSDYPWSFDAYLTKKK